MVESKARKSAFLREAIRALGLVGASVETARYEELLSRPDLHESFDVLTVRAVRVDARAMANLEAFLRPGGAIYLFTAAGNEDIVTALPPSLTPTADLSLIESLRSRLVVVERRRRR
jgi:16S rRNA (guanine527-N7)-methyltransferase